MGNGKLFRFVMAVLAVFAISQIAHMADGFLGLRYYMDPALSSVWSKFMMPNAGPPPATFFYMSVAFNLVASALFVLVYELIGFKKGLIYGFFVFLVASVTGMMMMYLIINLPLGLVLLWLAEDFIIKLAGGAAMGAIVK
jgi:hypothetical protein